MTDGISHEKAHEMWSEQQLALFQKMGTRDRLNAVKLGALENWTDATRSVALDLLGDNEIKTDSSPNQEMFRFEHARHPLLPQALRSPRMDRFMITALGGWTAIILATAAHAYGLY